MMDHDETIERVRRLIEVGIGGNDPAVIDELMAPDCIEHQRGNQNGTNGAKGVASTLHRWHSNFSLTVEDVAVAGDIVWTRNRARGVNTGSVMGHPPTGKSIDLDVIDIVRVRDGVVVEHWGVADQLGMMAQLGLLPSPERRPSTA
ncbi:MAG: ester cyclase [Dehalococcoidia bacterium]